MTTFKDAQAMAKMHPATFQAPSSKELEAIQEQDYDKVCIDDLERPWCVVRRVEGDKITAIIDNLLVYPDKHGLKYKDEIEFEKRHVYSVLREDGSYY